MYIFEKCFNLLSLPCAYFLFIYLFIQHFYSALFINKYALMHIYYNQFVLHNIPLGLMRPISQTDNYVSHMFLFLVYIR